MRRSIDAAVAAARARRQSPAAISEEVAKQQFRDAEVLRAGVTRLGPTAQAWAMAAAASDLERGALRGTPRPGACLGRGEAVNTS
jgi:hypothetical protein